MLLLSQALQEPGQFASQLVIGITNGAIIALIALGYTLVYGIIELINFAHGDNFMIGSFVGITVLSGTFLGLNFFTPITGDGGTLIKIVGVLIALVVAMAACGLIGVGIERVAYKPLRNSPRLAVLITAIGMSFILQNIGLIWKGPAQVPFPGLISDANIIPGEAVIFRWKDLFVIAVTVPLLVALSYFISNTRQGKAMRAVAQDKEAASMMGINVNRTISVTFLLGGILAGASGVMYGLFNEITVFNVGFTQGLYAFTAAVLGGIGNLSGAVVGGFLIGIIGSMADQYIGVRWTSIVIFAVLILVLVFRPRGLLGDRSAVQGGGE
ncbi:MAG: High-affinity branched-chain amino acid transport system permease protein LivH [uncultured Rubrobacteraceae bacterium]|uniref:High-affinity branched-chain amino acid transport system permease protein LivH n=2 Tax=uncultured Rubrobacteraceae bacterium TaxID=349277 RepID=A0A6J4Q2B4_9ACTN|nr:MAG: High-affinity branched-chain amino acid transport system permease protein LivH [uncultured Rubrobacteraceae bacterium]